MRMMSALALSVLLPALASAGVSTNPQSAPKGTYVVEPGHTIVTFCIRHMGISNYCGRFTKSEGKISFNGGQPERSTADVKVRIESLDTPSKKLDAKLLAEFFEVKDHPVASFTSKEVRVTGKHTGIIAGELTLRGKTRPIELQTTFNGGLIHPFANSYAIGFSARGKIRIDDFGFPDVAWRSFVGDEIELMIESEFLAEK